MKVLILVGTRPNFIKVTRFKSIANNLKGVDVRIVHTGQHFDEKMADVFFQQLGLQPDYFLDISEKTPAAQIGEIMIRLERLILQEFRPSVLIVPGDVNSTLAGALTANKLGIKLAHLESGLRSDDMSMPEEINRILTDQISDIHFVTEQSGVLNLIKQGANKDNVHLVGNTMIDTLVHFQPQISQSTILSNLGLNDSPYLLMTMHRPSNVDNIEGLQKMHKLISMLSERYKIVLPIHPRTRSRIESFGLTSAFESLENLILSDPLGYFEFQKLVENCKFVLTDSGGIQEESTYRKIPCLTLRENTERPVTIDLGTNTLVPFDVEVILMHIGEIEAGTYKKGDIPPLWDGHTTERIMKILCE